MSTHETNFVPAINLLKTHFGISVTYKNGAESPTTVTNAIFQISDAGEQDDGRGRASSITARVIIKVSDLATVERRGTITKGSDVYDIDAVETNDGIHRIDVVRQIRDDNIARDFRN